MPPKKKARKTSSSDGTGYGGGGMGDTKKLLAGRKRADREQRIEDCERTKYLQQVKLDIERNLSNAGDLDPSNSIVNDQDSQKIAKDLADIFRRQCLTDWDDRKDLYNAAFDLCRVLASDVRLGAVFGDEDDQEGVLFWLINFSNQAEQIMKRGASSDVVVWSDAEQGDLLLATQVAEVKDAALKMSLICQEKKPVEELYVVSLSERYQSELGSLRFDTVEAMTNVGLEHTSILTFSIFNIDSHNNFPMTS